ncbi:hypothetical protein [Micromonospora robiginosa]|uniref:MYXO-CTERM domain-containing protein n=1 Tax=Micromonospora robiginosa TaxID=2749844 RepID=A0A7L6B6E1_9ACTN|nr:hypothetical protein [Micromonospora ferruginea]QLQ37512.1 hypothetical protein H1D33_00945 [Micromonospora ferruginea]
MAKKMLGKVVAGAALGGAGLLVFTPGMAYAGGHDDEGKVIAKPHVVKAGDTVELLQICSEPQEHAYVWSKVTGKVDLHPARDGEHGDRADRGGDWEDADQGPDGKDAHADDHGKGPENKGPEGKGPENKGPEGKDDQGKDGHGPGEAGMPRPPADGPQQGGTGAGAAVDPAAQGAGQQAPEEYAQAAEPGWEASDWADDEHGADGKDRHGKDGKDEHGARPEDTGDQHGARPEDKGDQHGARPEDKGGEQGARPGDKGEDHGARPEAKDDEYGKDGKDEHGAEWSGGNEWQGGDEYGSGGDEAGWEQGKDFVYYGEARVSEDTHPGRYELRGSCGEGELVVLPHGGVDGGDGGMTTTGLDRGLATGGAGMIGAAALGGLVLLRRRRAGDLA